MLRTCFRGSPSTGEVELLLITVAHDKMQEQEHTESVYATHVNLLFCCPAV